MATIQELIDMLQQHVRLNPLTATIPIRDSLGAEIDGYSIGSKGTRLVSDYRPVVDNDYKWEYFEALFRLSGIEVLGHWEIPNGYWPDAYVSLRLEQPWWLVKTKAGMVQIGWRKRVIQISWEDTGIQIPNGVTKDEVTKSEYYVHAWNSNKALEYLNDLSNLLNKA